MQGSSLSSSLRLFDFSSFCLFDSLSLLPLSPVQQKYLSLEGYTVSNLGLQPGDSRRQGKISLEGYTPAKMAARAAASLPCSDPSLVPADSSLLRADLLLTARGTASLPPEGRHVYRPRGGK